MSDQSGATVWFCSSLNKTWFNLSLIRLSSCCLVFIRWTFHHIILSFSFRLFFFVHDIFHHFFVSFSVSCTLIRTLSSPRWTLLITTSRWDTTSRGENAFMFHTLMLTRTRCLCWLSFFRYPTIYLAPAGKKDEPIRYEVTQQLSVISVLILILKTTSLRHH